MPKKLKSRKFWVLIASTSAIAFLVNLGLDIEMAAKLITALGGSYSIGQGIADTNPSK